MEKGTPIEITEDCIITNLDGSCFLAKGCTGVMLKTEQDMAEIFLEEKNIVCQIPKKFLK